MSILGLWWGECGPEWGREEIRGCVRGRWGGFIYCCCCLVSQSCLTLCDTMYCSSPGSSVRGIFWARILEWVVISFCRIFLTQGLNPHLLLGRQILYHWITREALIYWYQVNFLSSFVSVFLALSHLKQPETFHNFSCLEFRKGFLNAEYSDCLHLWFVTARPACG